MVSTLVAVHAHPDDESITMGGTLARYAAAGSRVVVVTATLGEEGEVIGSGLSELVASRADQLGGYRHWELQAALVALGVTEHRYLGGIGHFRDSGMAGSPSAQHPRAFVAAGVDGPRHAEAVGWLAELFSELSPDAVLTYDADGGYGHPDHVTTHQVSRAAAARAGVPRLLAVVKPRAVFAAALKRGAGPGGAYRAARPEDIGYLAECADVAVDVAAFAGQRARALAAHATQAEVFGSSFALSNRLVQPLLDAEYFRVVAGPGYPAGAADLIGGS